MVTGDHALTGISVSRRCNLISKDGPTFIGELRQRDSTGEIIFYRADSTAHELQLVPLERIREMI